MYLPMCALSSSLPGCLHGAVWDGRCCGAGLPRSISADLQEHGLQKVRRQDTNLVHTFLYRSSLPLHPCRLSPPPPSPSSLVTPSLRTLSCPEAPDLCDQGCANKCISTSRNDEHANHNDRARSLTCAGASSGWSTGRLCKDSRSSLA